MNTQRFLYDHLPENGTESLPAASKKESLETADTQLHEKIQQLKSELEEKKSSDPSPAVLDIVQKAFNDLSKLTSGKTLDKAKTEAKLGEIRETLEYYGMVAQYEKDRKLVKDTLEKNARVVRSRFSDDLAGIIAEYPFISSDLRLKIENLGKANAKSMNALFQQTYLPEGTMSLLSYRKNPDAAKELARKMAESAKQFVGDSVPPLPEADQLWQQYEVARDGFLVHVIAKEQSGGKETVEKRVQAVLASLEEQRRTLEQQMGEDTESQDQIKGQLQVVLGKIYQISMLRTNTVGMIDLCPGNKRDEVQKRAWVIANFMDEMEKIQQGLLTGSRLDAALAVGGNKRDDISFRFSSELFGKDDKVLKANLGRYFFLPYNTPYRMESSGVVLSKVSLARCQVVDSQIYEIKDEKGQVKSFVKVIANPPDGPVVFVPRESVQTSPAGKDLPEKPKVSREEEVQRIEIQKQLRYDELKTHLVSDFMAKYEDILSARKAEVTKSYQNDEEMQQLRSGGAMMTYNMRIYQKAKEFPDVEQAYDEWIKASDEMDALEKELGLGPVKDMLKSVDEPSSVPPSEQGG